MPIQSFVSPRQWTCGLALALTLAICPSALAQEPDIDGGMDHPAFSRMAGFHINAYDHQQFSVFEFHLDPSKSVEGEYWSIEYLLNDGARKPGPLQIGRNYTNLIKQRGGLVLLESLDASGGTTIARLPIQGGGTLWLELQVNNGGEVYNVDIIQESAMAQEVAFTADSLTAALLADGSVPLRSILFDTGKASIQRSSLATLAVIIEMLTKNPSLRVEIQGHTDNIGRPATNLALSRARSAAVRDYLISAGGIAEGRLSASGFGDARPLADNSTEEGRAENRRVELVRR